MIVLNQLTEKIELFQTEVDKASGAQLSVYQVLI